VLRKDGRFATAVLHLWHQEADRSKLADNEKQLEQVRSGQRLRAQTGLAAIAAEIERSKPKPSMAQPVS
jgi:hypothetical protein